MATNRVLVDLHHADLFYSLQLLFEKRLGAEVFRPIGMEWYTEGYWHVYPHINVARQYLGMDNSIIHKDVHGQPLDKSAWVNASYTTSGDGIYYVMDVTKDKLNRGITLEAFKETEFDIIISSIPAHIRPFNELIRLYQPRAKHIFQIGNSWTFDPDVRNIMSSASPFPTTKHAIFYHQEFELDTFHYEPPQGVATVSSFIHYMQEMDIRNRFAAMLPDWTFRSYGAGMPEGNICKTAEIADRMRESDFIWHVKPGGDGFGYNIHEAYAVGRPVITRMHHYRGKLAEQLLTDQETCIDLDRYTEQEVASQLEYYNTNPEEHLALCQRAYDRFGKVVDYDQEFEELKTFMEDLR